MTLTCHRHGWEMADAMCGDCGLPFCGSCLFHVKKDAPAPLCVPCAMAAAGVRRRPPRLSRRERRTLAEQVPELASAADDAPPVATAEGMDASPCPPPETVPEPTWVTLDSNQWEIRPA